MTIQELHNAALTNDHNTYYQVFISVDDWKALKPVFYDKWSAMPQSVKQADVVLFDFSEDEACLVFAKLSSTVPSLCRI